MLKNIQEHSNQGYRYFTYCLVLMIFIISIDITIL